MYYIGKGIIPGSVYLKLTQSVGSVPFRPISHLCPQCLHVIICALQYRMACFHHCVLMIIIIKQIHGLICMLGYCWIRN